MKSVWQFEHCLVEGQLSGIRIRFELDGIDPLMINKIGIIGDKIQETHLR